MASHSTDHDTSDVDEEFGPVESAPAHMPVEEVFCRLLGHPAATRRQMKKNFYPKSTNSGTPEQWRNRRGVDVVLTDSKGAEWGVHKSVICTGSAPMGDYLYKPDSSNFVYTEDGKIKLLVAGFESFAIDAFVQSDYFGRYVLSNAIALSRARKVPETGLTINADEIAPGLQLLHHLEVLRLGDRLQHAVAMEAFGYIQLLLGRKTIGLADWLRFMQEVFHGQNPIRDTTLGQQVRMIVAAYAAYHDSIWLGHEEYRQLFRGTHNVFAGLCTEMRNNQAGLAIGACYVTASQHMGRMAIASLPSEISLDFAISAHAHSTAALPGNPRIENAAPPPAPPPVQPSTQVREDTLILPHIQSMLDEQRGVKDRHVR